MNTAYFYAHVPLAAHDGLVVLDQDGAVVYIALGRWHTLVSVMKQDFHKLAISPTVLGDRVKKAPFNESFELVKELLANPSHGDSLRTKISHRYVFGTELQHQVWQHLETLRGGETTTYTKVARALDLRLEMARVVANAVGANKLAVLVPCHRVLHLDGTISGFRWGVDLKKELLKEEGARFVEGGVEAV